MGPTDEEDDQAVCAVINRVPSASGLVCGLAVCPPTSTPLYTSSVPVPLVSTMTLPFESVDAMVLVLIVTLPASRVPPVTVPVVVRFSSPNEIAPLESTILPSPRVRLPIVVPVVKVLAAPSSNPRLDVTAPVT